jgi:hypothetical protein
MANHKNKLKHGSTITEGDETSAIKKSSRGEVSEYSHQPKIINFHAKRFSKLQTLENLSKIKLNQPAAIPSQRD